MWMILALFGALAAGSAADTLLSARNQDNDDGSDTDDDDLDTTSDRDAAQTVGLDAFLPTDPPPDVPTPDPVAVTSPDAATQDPATPDHEIAPERIHSSDLYPEPPPPAPIVAELTDPSGTLNGGAQNDVLSSGGVAGLLAGHGGDDWLSGGSAPMHLIGGEGQDVLHGGTGDDSLEGCAGDDILIGGAGSNVLLGGQGDDVLLGLALTADGTDIGGQDFLNGGDGDDLLIAGASDYLHGGAGADGFVLGDWGAGSAATIVDFTPDEDQILLHFDPARIADPMVDIRFDPDAPETAQIWLNDQIVAQVMNAPDLTVADIGLVPLSLTAAQIAAQ